MKLIKTLLLIAVISAMTFSCKETKKEQVDGEMEVVEETVEVEDVEAEVEAEVETAEGSTEVVEVTETKSTESAAPAEAVVVSSAGLEETVVEGVMVDAMADTPVIYPGCEGSVNEIRACSIEQFTAFLKKNFNPDRAADLNFESGQHTIRSLIKVDQNGKASVLKVQEPHKGLDKEISRVIDELPSMTAATKDGQPVSVSFILPLTFSII